MRPSLAEEIAGEKCKRPMVLRYSRRGPFLGCSGYPKCRGTKPLTEEQEKKVPAHAPKRANAWGVASPAPDEPPGKPEEGDPTEEDTEGGGATTA